MLDTDTVYVTNLYISLSFRNVNWSSYQFIKLKSYSFFHLYVFLENFKIFLYNTPKARPPSLFWKEEDPSCITASVVVLSCNSFLALASCRYMSYLKSFRSCADCRYLEIVFSWFCDQKPFILPIGSTCYIPWRVGTRKQYCCSRWLYRAPNSQSVSNKSRQTLFENIYCCKYTNHL